MQAQRSLLAYRDAIRLSASLLACRLVARYSGVVAAYRLALRLRRVLCLAWAVRREAHYLAGKLRRVVVVVRDLTDVTERLVDRERAMATVLRELVRAVESERCNDIDRALARAHTALDPSGSGPGSLIAAIPPRRAQGVGPPDIRPAEAPRPRLTIVQ